MAVPSGVTATQAITFREGCSSPTRVLVLHPPSKRQMGRPEREGQSQIAKRRVLMKLIARAKSRAEERALVAQQ